MRRKISAEERIMREEAPINWGRAIITGMMASAFMSAYLGIFSMMGLLHFSIEFYLGNAMLAAVSFPNRDYAWTIGLLGNLVFGAIFAMFYAYFFEFVFRRASARLGLLLGIGHALLAGIAFFPFFGIANEFLGTNTYPNFGFLGWGISAGLVPVLIVGHMLFGATVGVLYGPVRIARIRSREWEPGETGNYTDPDVITEEEDPRERLFGY